MLYDGHQWIAKWVSKPTNWINGSRDSIQFHKSLVVVICKHVVHGKCDDYVPMKVEAEQDMSEVVSTDYNEVSESNMALDLYTSTALIGRDDLDITLENLLLQQEAVRGTLTLYAVLRPIGNDGAVSTNGLNDIGANEIFRFSNHWVGF